MNKAAIVLLPFLGLASQLLVPASAVAETREIVILSTNDFHSAVDPILAYWLSDEPNRRLGGAAHLMTLVEQIREREQARGVPVFLFDSGDMFTGMLAKLTRGEALMEMMTTLRYDALGIGNHEFDYGWRNFRDQMFRVPFPSLAANIFYKNSATESGEALPYARPHTIIERGGVRLGVIGIIGLDARSVVLPSFVEALEFTDPVAAIEASKLALEDDVDLIVVLAHQGKTGPMQADAEHFPEVQRDFDADIETCGAVSGIDIFLAGHAHRGIEEPYVHPKTGCIISQTYGYGTRLGFLRLMIDTETGKVLSHEGELLKVWSDELPPHQAMAAKMGAYQDEVAAVANRVVGELTAPLGRAYNDESALGDFVTDVMRERGGADVAITNAGGLRADIDQGPVTAGEIHDALPFFNTVVTLNMTGAQIEQVLEQGLTLERGMVQVSGLVARYDLSAESGRRLVSLDIAGQPVDPKKNYRVATHSFLAEGGDLYSTFLEAAKISPEDADIAAVDIADAVIEYFEELGRAVAPTEVGARLVAVVPGSGASKAKSN